MSLSGVYTGLVSAHEALKLLMTNTFTT